MDPSTTKVRVLEHRASTDYFVKFKLELIGFYCGVVIPLLSDTLYNSGRFHILVPNIFQANDCCVIMTDIKIAKFHINLSLYFDTTISLIIHNIILIR